MNGCTDKNAGKNNIILIGFMGSGKTTFGRWIEKNHGMKLIDTDKLISLQEEKSINAIFAEHGEEYFRNLETECVKSLNEQNTVNTVVSVGGGLPLREVNGQELHSLGIVVYLRAKVDTLVKRLSHDKSRPLLAGGDVEAKINDLMGRRASIYEERADLIIDTDDMSFEKMYGRIKEYEDSCN